MKKPLAGKTILVTRPRAQSSGLIADLEGLGATVYSMPVIEIHPPEDTGALDEALRKLESYDWVVFTSVNGVKAVEERLAALGIPAQKLSERKLAVIGPATANELARVARQPDLVPAEYVSEAIAEAFPETNGRFLLARADIARKDLAHLLRAKGAEVDEIAAYRIVRSEEVSELPTGAPDYITLTSSSAARGTQEILLEKGRGHWMSQSKLATIGPITSATVRELGYEVAIEAEEYTAPGLVRALMKHANPLTPEGPNAGEPSPSGVTHV